MLGRQVHHPHHGASNRAGQGPQTKAVIQCTTDDKRDCSCYLVTKTCLLGGRGTRPQAWVAAPPHSSKSSEMVQGDPH